MCSALSRKRCLSASVRVLCYQRVSDVRVGLVTFPTLCPQSHQLAAARRTELSRPRRLFYYQLTRPYTRDCSQRFAGTGRHDSLSPDTLHWPNHYFDQHSLALLCQWRLRIPCSFLCWGMHGTPFTHQLYPSCLARSCSQIASFMTQKLFTNCSPKLARSLEWVQFLDRFFFFEIWVAWELAAENQKQCLSILHHLWYQC